MAELSIDFDTHTEEEGPYEALYNAVSCHSLDSTASGRSSDRDSVSKEGEATGPRTAGVRPVSGCSSLWDLGLVFSGEQKDPVTRVPCPACLASHVNGWPRPGEKAYKIESDCVH